MQSVYDNRAPKGIKYFRGSMNCCCNLESWDTWASKI